MSEDKIKSKNKLQKRNHRSKDDSIKRKNIFQLIEPINKKLPLITEKIIDLFAFAENLISFFQEKHPEDLLELSFNPELDDIRILAARLSNLAIDLGYTIVFDKEYGGNAIKILYSIRRHEFLLYVIEFNWIDEINSEELKIGYANLLHHFGKQAYINVLQYDYEEPEDNCFDAEFQWRLEEDMYCDEQGDLDEGQLQEACDDVQEQLKRLRDLKAKWFQYKSKPFSVFLDYNPINQHEIAFKNFILEGLKIDFTIMQKFMPDNNIYDDGGVSFEQSLLVFFDCSEGIEEEWMMNFQENSNNEWADPMGWYSVSKGKVENMTTQKDINTMYNNFQYLTDLFDKHLNKLKEWNI